MSRLPVVSARQLVNALHKIGYDTDHQQGSHIILRNKVSRRILSVPNHREIARGTQIHTATVGTGDKRIFGHYRRLLFKTRAIPRLS